MQSIKARTEISVQQPWTSEGRACVKNSIAHLVLQEDMQSVVHFVPRLCVLLPANSADSVFQLIRPDMAGTDVTLPVFLQY